MKNFDIKELDELCLVIEDILKDSVDPQILSKQPDTLVVLNRGNVFFINIDLPTVLVTTKRYYQVVIRDLFFNYFTLTVFDTSMESLENAFIPVKSFLENFKYEPSDRTKPLLDLVKGLLRYHTISKVTVLEDFIKIHFGYILENISEHPMNFTLKVNNSFQGIEIGNGFRDAGVNFDISQVEHMEFEAVLRALV